MSLISSILRSRTSFGGVDLGDNAGQFCMVVTFSSATNGMQDSTRKLRRATLIIILDLIREEKEGCLFVYCNLLVIYNAEPSLISEMPFFFFLRWEWYGRGSGATEVWYHFK